MPAEKTKSLTEKTALEWVRAIYMQGVDVFEEEKPVLFENIEPSDICQGHPGTVWNTRKSFLFQGLLMGRKFYAFPTCCAVNEFGRGKKAIFLS